MKVFSLALGSDVYNYYKLYEKEYCLKLQPSPFPDAFLLTAQQFPVIVFKDVLSLRITRVPAVVTLISLIVFHLTKHHVGCLICLKQEHL